MSYYHAVFGEIGIDPPLSTEEVASLTVNSEVQRFDEIAFRIGTSHLELGDDAFAMTGAVAIIPAEDGCGRDVLEELGAVASLFGKDHTFTGWLHCTFEAGLYGPDLAPCERYYIRGNAAVGITPELVWPEEVR